MSGRDAIKSAGKKVDEAMDYGTLVKKNRQ